MTVLQDGSANWPGRAIDAYSIQTLEQTGCRPDQMAIRIRAHSDLLLTSRNKSSMATSEWDSWSGDHPQTILFPLDDTSRLQHNINITDTLFNLTTPSIAAYGGRLVHDVTPETIAKYLSNYQAHHDATAFRPMALGRWILSRASKGELVEWTIFVASPDDRKTVNMGTLELGLVERRLISSNSIGTHCLIQDMKELIFQKGPQPFAETADLTMLKQCVEHALLRAAYDYLPAGSRFLGVEDKVPTVIGLALSLPFTTDIGTEWIVKHGGCKWLKPLQHRPGQGFVPTNR
jgi:hypothetical protein